MARTQGHIKINIKKTSYASLDAFMEDIFKTIKTREIACFLIGKKISKPEGMFFKELKDIHQEIKEDTGYDFSIRNVYNTLSRLKALGLIYKKNNTYYLSESFSICLMGKMNFWKAYKDEHRHTTLSNPLVQGTHV